MEIVKDQIEKAFNYRGHVAVEIDGGERIEGFLYNRQFDEGYIEIIPKDSEVRRRIDISMIRSVALTGKDCAETFDQYKKRTDLP